MQVKRFVAANMRRALELVRSELGEDAMILSTQRTAKGVELVVSVDQQDDTLSEQEVSASAESASYHVQEPLALATKKARVGLASGKTPEQLAEEMEVARQRMLAMKREENLTLGELADQHAAADVEAKKLHTQTKAQRVEHVESIPPSNFSRKENSGESDKLSRQTLAQVQRADEEIRRLQDEIISMREAFTGQLNDMVEQQSEHLKAQQEINEIMPMITEVKQRLRSLGLTQACNDELIRSLKSLDDSSMTQQNLWYEALARLGKKIPANTDDPIAKGGTYALLGPTGVGKTTTIAKLAARFVIANGPKQVALLTTDTYRIAAHDQLQSLGDILNIEVHVVNDLMQLPQHLEKLKSYRLVLVDTPGMRHGDDMFKAHLNVLRRCQNLQSYLVLAANSQYQMLQAILHRYRLAEPKGCILSKLDECVSLGDAISMLATNKLPLSYITHGQAVPDDLSIIKPHQLLAKAVSLNKVSNAEKWSVNERY